MKLINSTVFVYLSLQVLLCFRSLLDLQGTVYKTFRQYLSLSLWWQTSLAVYHTSCCKWTWSPVKINFLLVCVFVLQTKYHKKLQHHSTFTSGLNVSVLSTTTIEWYPSCRSHHVSSTRQNLPVNFHLYKISNLRLSVKLSYLDDKICYFNLSDTNQHLVK